jgi:hypothetical protein
MVIVRRENKNGDFIGRQWWYGVGNPKYSSGHQMKFNPIKYSKDPLFLHD